MFFTLLFAVALAPPDTWAFMEELRGTRSFVNGEIRFEVSVHDGVGGDRPVETRVGEFRFFGDDAIWSARDPYDDFSLSVLPTPHLRRARVGRYQVFNSGTSLSSAISTNGFDFELPLQDYRQIGLFPSAESMSQGDHDFLRAIVQGEQPRLDRDNDGGLIRTILEAGSKRLVVWQDPRRGNQVVKSQLWQGQVLGYECRTELREVGRGRWFPGKVEYFQGSAGALQPIRTVRLTSVSIDEEDAQPITLADAGIEVGTNISIADSAEDAADNVQKASSVRNMMAWDGLAFVGMPELSERIKSGELELGPQFREEIAASRLARKLGERDRFLRMKSTQAAPAASAWRRYTMNFIERYSLDDSQRQKAHLLCDRAEEKASRMVKRVAVDDAALEKARESAIAAELANEDTPRDAAAMFKRQTELLTVIQRVFSEELKPGLARLLTRKQRSRFEEEESK